MSDVAAEDSRFCGRIFTGAEIAQIRQLIAANPDMNRAGLARAVCDELAWMKRDGHRKDMSCRVAMLRMHRAGLIKLPPPAKGNGNRNRRPRLTSASDPEFPLSAPAGSLGVLKARLVDSSRNSSLWNEFIERYHYLGYQPLPGAQLRYLVSAGSRLLALLGFGASAWKTGPRDRWIGWTTEERKRQLHLVVNNARFLILPWIHSKNLASRILATVARRLPGDWNGRYGYRPVLIETFVERERFQGTCYRAANWIHVGQTQGRGKLDVKHEHAVPVKEVFLFPLHKQFRRKLRPESNPGGD
jgi:hypothetical protein